MRRLAAPVLLLVVATACSGSKDSSPTPTTPTPPAPVATSLAGSVSAQDGSKLQNVTVRIYDGPNAGKSTTTNATGDYSLDNLTAGNANVVASTFIHGEVVKGLYLSGAQRLDFTMPTPACQSNNTGWVHFGNRNATTAQDVIWDGAKMFTLAPGQDSPEISTAAGVPHTLLFRVANSTRTACSQGNPIISQCSRPSFTCTGP